MGLMGRMGVMGQRKSGSAIDLAPLGGVGFGF
jgi:hypothetical protein